MILGMLTISTQLNAAGRNLLCETANDHQSLEYVQVAGLMNTNSKHKCADIWSSGGIEVSLIFAL